MTRIHATKVPMVEFEIDNKVYKFVYNLATMNYIAQLAREDKLPTTEDMWDEEHIKSLVEATGLTHHSDEDWDKVFADCSAASLVQLGIALSQMVGEENQKAFGSGVSEGEEVEENTPPTEEPVKRRRKARTG